MSVYLLLLLLLVMCILVMIIVLVDIVWIPNLTFWLLLMMNFPFPISYFVANFVCILYPYHIVDITLFARHAGHCLHLSFRTKETVELPITHCTLLTCPNNDRTILLFAKILGTTQYDRSGCVIFSSSLSTYLLSSSSLLLSSSSIQFCKIAK